MPLPRIMMACIGDRERSFVLPRPSIISSHDPLLVAICPSGPELSDSSAYRSAAFARPFVIACPTDARHGLAEFLSSPTDLS